MNVVEDDLEKYWYTQLSSINYFSLDLDADGHPSREFDGGGLMKDLWLNGQMDVYLTVNVVGEQDTAQLLRKRLSISNSYDTILNEVGEGGMCAGILLDMPDLDPSLKDAYVDYVRGLHQALETNREGPGNLKLGLFLSPFDSKNVYDFNSLSSVVDFYIVGSDYENKHDPNFNYKLSIQNYLTRGVPANKLILTIPYYGSSWQVNNGSGESNHTFLEHSTYAEIVNYYGENHGTFDPELDIIVIKDGENEQILYDNKRTIADKFDFVIENRLGGVYIWALGYDAGRTELWDLLGEKFAY